jgi:carbon starvation protein CstA
MDNNENVIEEGKPSFGARLGEGIKEFFRKRVVGLKRSTHMIPLIITLVASVCYLLWLKIFSITVTSNQAASWTGFCVFVNNLLSILVLALYLSAFPKRKKPNLILVALIFVFYAIMIVCDVEYYVLLNNYLEGRQMSTEAAQSLNYSIAHIIMLGICVVALATLPLYKKLIMMINTKKEVKSNDIKEVIDTED